MSDSLAKPDFKRASELAGTEREWVFQGWLPKKKITALIGGSSIQNALIALEVASVVSKGGEWVKGAPGCRAAQVIFLCRADAVSDTVVPYFHASNAELEAIHIVGVEKNDDPDRIDTVVARLCNALSNQEKIPLVIVAGLDFLVSKGSTSCEKLHAALGRIRAMAEQFNCAVLITARSPARAFKSPTSVAQVIERSPICDLSDVVWIALPDSRFSYTNDNYGVEGRGVVLLAQPLTHTRNCGLAYDVRTTFIWKTNANLAVSEQIAITDTLIGTPEFIFQMIARQVPKFSTFADQAASQWLQQLLSTGEKPVAYIKKEAKKAGHAWSTIERASHALNLRKSYDSITPPWRWSLN